MNYTELAVLSVALTLLLDLVVLRTRLVTRKAFWTSYAILLVFQLLSDGVLAERHIVRYNSADIVGPRLVGAPVEDLLYGFSLITQTLCWWVWWGRRGVQRR